MKTIIDDTVECQYPNSYKLAPLRIIDFFRDIEAVKINENCYSS